MVILNDNNCVNDAKGNHDGNRSFESDEFVELITSNPTCAQVAECHLSEETQAHIRFLLDINRNNNLTESDAEELDEYVQLKYMIQKAKVRAYEKLA